MQEVICAFTMQKANNPLEVFFSPPGGSARKDSYCEELAREKTLDDDGD